MQEIQMVAILVPDYDLALDFYVSKLGFILIEDKVQSGDKRWVVIAPSEDKGTRLLLSKAVNPRQIAAIGNQTGGRVGFFLTVDNFSDSYDRFLANGVKFEESPRHEAYGSVAVFSDPFGNRWDMLSQDLSAKTG
jgi:catechol 2,3-dioxygenase-like lactoylglutathione lyase family enzyme